MSARDEWEQIIQDDRDIYIYGAGKFGKILLKRFQKDGHAGNVKGFLVTDRENNPLEIDHKEVMTIRDFHDQDALILVAVPRPFQEDILSTLKRACFNDVVNAEKFLFMETEDVVAVKVRDLLEMQANAASFEGYDIIVRLLAIEYRYGINDFGAELLKKIGDQAESIDKDMIARSADEEILIDIHGKILAGKMNFASALSVGKLFVRVRTVSGQTAPDKYGFNWLKCHFNENEIKLIIARYHALLQNNKEEGHNVLIEEIKEIYGKEQEFGNDKFYQSLEELEIPGERPTEKRIEIYGLQDIVKNKAVLDIGSNCGFLDIRLGLWAKSVKGIEYNESLVKIANIVRDYLGRSNVFFESGDFRNFVTTEEYDVIFSFAVHHWIGMAPKAYCRKLVSMLKDKGYIFFESHGTNDEDKDYARYCLEFESHGLLKIREDEICDDGKCLRNFVIYQKQ